MSEAPGILRVDLVGGDRPTSVTVVFDAKTGALTLQASDGDDETLREFVESYRDNPAELVDWMWSQIEKSRAN